MVFENDDMVGESFRIKDGDMTFVPTVGVAKSLSDGEYTWITGHIKTPIHRSYHAFFLLRDGYLQTTVIPWRHELLNEEELPLLLRKLGVRQSDFIPYQTFYDENPTRIGIVR